MIILTLRRGENAKIHTLDENGEIKHENDIIIKITDIHSGNQVRVGIECSDELFIARGNLTDEEKKDFLKKFKKKLMQKKAFLTDSIRKDAEESDS